MTAPRGVEERIEWFLTHRPSGPGMCAQHSWHSLGGNYGNPPAWQCEDANEIYAKVKSSGRFFTTLPPRGALVLWRYGANGHAAISYGDGKIATTDPTGKPGGTGVEPLSYPTKWGASSAARIWTDQYNGVRFAVGGNMSDTDGYMSLEEGDKRAIRTNTVVKLDINGKTQFKAEQAGRQLMAMYFNIDVPPAGSEERKALNRGGVRSWFQEYSATEEDHRDETGYLGPIPIPVWGNQHSLWSRVWPHTVDTDFWEFCIQVYAYDANGKEVDIPLTLQTRQVKMINDKT
jgi:hypothetical protein